MFMGLMRGTTSQLPSLKYAVAVLSLGTTPDPIGTIFMHYAFGLDCIPGAPVPVRTAVAVASSTPRSQRRFIES